MGQQPQLRREKPIALLVHEMVHPDVVLGDVLRGGRRGLPDGQIHVGRDALGKPLGQARLRPLAARPPLALGQPLRKCRQREVQEHRERKLIGEEIVDDVRRRVVAGQRLVEREDRAQVEVRLPSEVAVDLEHVAVQRLQDEFHPLEERVESLRIRREIHADKVFEGRRVPVFRAPERRDLPQTAGEPRARLLVRFRAELLLEPCRGVLHPGRRRGVACWLLRLRHAHGGHEDNRPEYCHGLAGC